MKAVPIPPLMRDLPRDPRGLAITYTSMILEDGRYDFTRADMAKWMECVTRHQCGLCGKPLHKRQWFIGGPLTMINRLFFDLAMHEECARYALAACPYLATVQYHAAKKRNIASHEVAAEKVLASSSGIKPEVFGLACTDGYTPVRYGSDLLVRAKRWTRDIEWWTAGERVPPFDLEGYRQQLLKVQP